MLTVPLVFVLVVCGDIPGGSGHDQKYGVETVLAGLSERSVQEPGQWGHGQQLSLRPWRGLWARAAAGLQLSGRLWAGRSLGLEEGGAGNVELPLAQSGLRAVYSRTLGISRAFPRGAEQLRVCERWPVA